MEFQDQDVKDMARAIAEILPTSYGYETAGFGVWIAREILEAAEKIIRRREQEKEEGR